jgi:hypothetical protein
MTGMFAKTQKPPKYASCLRLRGHVEFPPFLIYGPHASGSIAAHIPSSSPKKSKLDGANTPALR